MDSSCLSHRLTEQQRSAFQQQGYLVIPDALSRREVKALVGKMDALHLRAVADGLPPTVPYVLRNFMPEADEFIECLDNPRVRCL